MRCYGAGTPCTGGCAGTVCFLRAPSRNAVPCRNWRKLQPGVMTTAVAAPRRFLAALVIAGVAAGCSGDPSASSTSRRGNRAERLPGNADQPRRPSWGSGTPVTPARLIAATVSSGPSCGAWRHRYATRRCGPGRLDLDEVSLVAKSPGRFEDHRTQATAGRHASSAHSKWLRSNRGTESAVTFASAGCWEMWAVSGRLG